MAKPGRMPRKQFAALPWRRTEAGVEMLLITSKETRRWVIPKGWGKKGEAGPFAAAREALEETGVAGAVRAEPIGDYRYDKLLKGGRMQRVRVSVYALEVVHEHEDWPERTLREKLWIPPKDAARLVDEPELREMLAAFEP